MVILGAYVIVAEVIVAEVMAFGPWLSWALIPQSRGRQLRSYVGHGILWCYF